MAEKDSELRKNVDRMADAVITTSSIEPSRHMPSRADLTGEDLCELHELASETERTLEELLHSVETLLRILTEGELKVLTYVETREEPQSPIVIAKDIALTRARVTQIVNDLEARGLLTKEPDPHDGRKVRVGITDAGRQICHQERLKMQALIENFFMVLGRDDSKEFVRLLGRTRDISAGFDLTNAIRMMQSAHLPETGE